MCQIYPLEIPGVATMTFLRTAMNASDQRYAYAGVAIGR